MQEFGTFLRDLLAAEDGVTAIEYGLIATLIAVTLIASISGVGDGLVATFGSVQTSIDGATGAGT